MGCCALSPRRRFAAALALALGISVPQGAHAQWAAFWRVASGSPSVSSAPKATTAAAPAPPPQFDGQGYWQQQQQQQQSSPSQFDAQQFVQSYTQQAGSAPGGPDGQPLQINVLEMFTVNDVDEYAVCNDGSPGAYYYAPSPSGSNQWLIYLEGGMWCWDQQSCQSRMQSTPFEMSSTGWKSTQIVGGVFNSQSDNPFLTYNKVYLGYCSSDAWMGDVAASSATWGYAFRGQRIIEATIADLQARHGMAAGAEVIFGGCSAGARGALVNLDYISSMVPTGSTVRGLLDSGLWVDVEPIDSSQVSLQEQTQMVASFISPGARIPTECAMEYVGEEWKCLFGVYRLPFISTPYLINAAQFDSFAMIYDENGNVPATQGQVALADQFQQAIVQALQIAIQNNMAVFSSTCLVHCLTDNTQLYTGSQAITVNNEDIEAVLEQWLGGGTPVLISNCQGYGCVQQCPGGQNIPYIQQAIAAAQAPPAAGTEVNGVWLNIPGLSNNGQHVGGAAVAAGPQAQPTWMQAGRRLLRA